MTRVRVRLTGVKRSYGPVLALDGATLELRAGEVHGVLGANGAGKSTLLNVLGGMIQPDAGTIEIDGAHAAFSSPRDAWRRGIGLVHQHFTLVPALTVLENLNLGRRGSVPVRTAAEAVMHRTGLSVPLAPTVDTLGVGDRQRIEILKALLRDPTVLVLDEPTAVLTPAEIEGLFGLLRDLAREDRAVVLVSHKLDEVLRIADRITVLRAGRTVLSGARGEHPVDDLVRAMVGGGGPSDPIAVGVRSDPPAETDRADRPNTEAADRVVARLEGVCVAVDGVDVLDGVDLVARAGEVIGIAGVEGNGQRELALVLAGLLTPSHGTTLLPEGIGFIPQDRNAEGSIADFDLTENVALALHRRTEYGNGVRLRWPELRAAAERIRRIHGVGAPSVSVRIGTLSGGNRQRVVVGREIEMASELLVAENPSRGLDVAAAAFVHDEIRRLSGAGVSVVLLSTDLDEVMGLARRLYVIARGRVTEVASSRRTREEVGALMLSGATRA